MNKRNIYIEGSQEIIFSSDWTVIKVDEHPYYRSVSGRGLKSVDFFALHPEWGLALIELKDYSSNGKISNTTDELHKALIKKEEDSIRLIRIIYKMYNRKWYYRLLLSVKGFQWLIPKRTRVWVNAWNMVQAGRYFYLADIYFVKTT